MPRTTIVALLFLSSNSASPPLVLFTDIDSLPCVRTRAPLPHGLCASKGVWKCRDEQTVSRRLHRWDLRQCTFPTRTSLDTRTTTPPHEHRTVDPEGRALRRILRYDLRYATERVHIESSYLGQTPEGGDISNTTPEGGDFA